MWSCIAVLATCAALQQRITSLLYWSVQYLCVLLPAKPERHLGVDRVAAVHEHLSARSSTVAR